MVELEIDGQKVQVPEGAMVMDAAHLLGLYVPHFCYHKKLSIAANCRMCLVDVEKAPKPLPACATPVAQGMIVRTRSEKAITAQKGVMEFLLINHPLDCPICDQGGECQLQDLAVGYGGSASRYTEEKRVVFHKDVGPLVAMEEMSRCIQCTRCVRFGQEVAGVMELGMANRGEHSEIMAFVGSTVDSELSGNMIDICPVGALTSKPFRYAARTWELSRRASISPHDSLGANLIVQVKGDQVMRVVPQENEAVNECWLSDRDRFAYEGLNAADRLRQPQIRENGAWKAVDWPTALEVAVSGLRRALEQGGADAVGALAAPTSTVEELHLLQKLVRALGSDNIDTRLRQADPMPPQGDIPWLGMSIASVSHLDAALFIGSFLRKDHPLLSARVRHVAKAGARISSLHAVDDDWFMPLHARMVAAPSQWVGRLAAIAVAVAHAKGVAVPAELQAAPAPDAAAQAVADSLIKGEHKAVFLGNAAVDHPQAQQIRALAQWIAAESGAVCGDLVEGGNAVGAALVGAQPSGSGRSAMQLVDQPARAMLLFGVEPERDLADPSKAAALRKADFLVAFSMFTPSEGSVIDQADVLLPIVPFTETAGSLVNCEGRLQRFNPVVQPLADARPGWKVLRVLGSLMDLPGFGFETVDPVRAEAFALVGGEDGIAARLEVHSAQALPTVAQEPAATLERIAPVPIYASDAIVRRAVSLQATRDARDARQVGIAPGLWAQLGLQAGDAVRVRSAQGEVVMPARLDKALADGVVRIATGLEATAQLGPLFESVSIEKAPAAAPANVQPVAEKV